MNLLTEAGDNFVTENDNNLTVYSYPVCDWPTLDEVKLELGVVILTDDAYIQRQIDATIQAIEYYCRRKIPFQYGSDFFNISDSYFKIGYNSLLQIKRWPITQVDRLYYTDDDSDIEYTINDNGEVSGNFNKSGQIRINYYGGLGCPIPDDILDVFYRMVTVRYASKDIVPTQTNIRSESVPGVFKTDYFETANGSDYTVFDAKNYGYILNNYRSLFI